jgi:hypothetical protein
MNTILLKAKGAEEIYSFDSTTHLFDFFGGPFNIVRCREHLKYPFVLITDDCGFFKRLEVNERASFFYGVQKHGNQIVGDVFIMKEVADYDECGYTLVGLSQDEINALAEEHGFTLGGLE